MAKGIMKFCVKMIYILIFFGSLFGLSAVAMWIFTTYNDTIIDFLRSLSSSSFVLAGIFFIIRTLFLVLSKFITEKI